MPAADGAGPDQCRDRRDGGVHAHPHLVRRNEVAQADTGGIDAGDEGAFMAVMRRDRLHLGRPQSVAGVSLP